MGSIIGWMILGSIGGFLLADYKGRNTTIWTILGMTLGLLALIVLVILPKATNGKRYVKCLSCAETVRAEAKVCRYCHRDIATINVSVTN